MRFTDLLEKLDEIKASTGDVPVLLPYGEFGFEHLTEVTVEEVYSDALKAVHQEFIAGPPRPRPMGPSSEALPSLEKPSSSIPAASP